MRESYLVFWSGGTVHMPNEAAQGRGGGGGGGEDGSVKAAQT